MASTLKELIEKTSFVDELDVSFIGKPLYVQVLNEWMEHFDYHPPERWVILADTKGNRISATVRNEYLYRFKDAFRKEKWFIVKDYQVSTKPYAKKFTEPNHHIFFHIKTDWLECDSPVERPVEHFKRLDKLLDGSVIKETNVVDFVGGVLEVKHKIDDVLHFVLGDILGHRIQCRAKGFLADDFERMWLSNPKRNRHDPTTIARRGKTGVVCVLKYWDLIEENDEFVLEGSSVYSMLDFDTPNLDATDECQDNINFWNFTEKMVDDYWGFFHDAK